MGIKSLIVFVLIILAGVAGFFLYERKDELAIVTPASTPLGEKDLFELDKKQPGTKMYYSEKLGVGFTYLPYSADTTITLKESVDKISFNNQTIEVFRKDPQISLEEAIQGRFLKNYDPADCFVLLYDNGPKDPKDYVFAGISFPPSEDPSDPWWKNGEKCPENYSETNAVQYFIMNKDVPGKFVFVSLGQSEIASDGSGSVLGGSSWSNSIRILK